MSRWLLGSSSSITSGAERSSLASKQPPLLPAGERPHLAREVLGLEAEAGEDVLDFVIELERVVMPEQFRQSVELRAELLSLDLVGAGREFLRDALELGLRRDQFVEGRFRLVEERAARGELFDLHQRAEPSPGVKRDLPGVRFIEARRGSSVSVVLPAPFGPTNPTRSPACISNDTSSKSGVAS